jgi:RNA recognition motif-containing protein
MSSTVFIVPLATAVSEEHLRELFNPFGEVQNIKRPFDREADKPRNYAFVTMATDEQAQAAVKGLHGTTFGGEPITARIADERQQSGPRTTPIILPQKVFIGNLPSGFSDEQIAALVSEFGEAKSVRRATDAETGIPARSATVTMMDSAQARVVLENLHGRVVEGCDLDVRYLGRTHEESLAFIVRAANSPPPAPPSSPDKRAFAKQIAEKLGETELKPIQQIRRLIDFFGQEQVQKWLDETMEIEANGGLLVPDGTRRRTPGGVFFFHTRNAIEEPLRNQIFPRYYGKGLNPPNVTSAQPPFQWAERGELLAALREQAGQASTVKTTVIGRPGKVDDRGQYVIITIDEVLDNKLVPKGVPRPPSLTTRYLLYVGSKQWRRVQDALRADKQDKLVAEGVPSQERSDLIVVYVTLATTIAIETARRNDQKAQSQENGG